MRQMDQYLDQRIINTKQDLFAALFNLLKVSTSIKVLDICKKANITAMTFYHHYGDKTQLLEDAIKDQVSLRLPIPIKLRPNNLKQLIYYLIKFFSDFCSTNKVLLISTFNLIYLKIKNTYLDIWIKTVSYYINKELSRMCNNFQQITININSDFITLGLIGLFLKRIKTNKDIEFETIKNNINLFVNNYVNIK